MATNGWLMGGVKAQVRYDPSVDMTQPRGDLRTERAALEAEVARLQTTLARLEARLSHDETRQARPSSYFWGLMFGLLALAMAASWLYYGFMHVLSLD
jgi:hypothetical protein